MFWKQLFFLTFFALSPLALIASHNCFSWQLGVRGGYRQDSLNSAFLTEKQDVNGNTYYEKFFQESFESVRGPQIEAFTSFLLYYLELGVDADYSWVTQGEVKSMISNPSDSFSSILASFKSNVRGNFWDAYGRAKIHFPLYWYCWTKFALIPEGGYSIHHQSLKRTDLESGGYLGKQFTRTWQGPYVGGNVLWETTSFYLEGGYAYHWLDREQKLHLRNLSTLSEAVNHFKEFKDFSDIGHQAWLTLAYRVPCKGRIGIRGTYFLVDFSHKICSEEDFSFLVIQLNRQEEIKIKTKWEAFSILLEAAFAY